MLNHCINKQLTDKESYWGKRMVLGLLHDKSPYKFVHHVFFLGAVSVELLMAEVFYIHSQNIYLRRRLSRGTERKSHLQETSAPKQS